MLWLLCFFGTVLAGSAYYIDKKDPTSNYPFWGYLFGVVIFEGGFGTLVWWPVFTSQWFDLFYAVVNVGLALLYIVTQRDIFIWAGSVGVVWYASEIVNKYFHSYALPILLTAVGLALILLAVYLSSKWIKRSRVKIRTVVETA